LQKTADAIDTAIRLNSSLAKRLNLNNTEQVLVRQDGCEVSMAMQIDDGIPDDCAWIPMGNPESSNLGAMFGAIELEAE
jgi:formylmethanofuran dehydrogenase subunit D